MNFVYKTVKEEGDYYKSDFVQKAYYYEFDKIIDNQFPVGGKPYPGINSKHVYMYDFIYDKGKSR